MVLISCGGPSSSAGGATSGKIFEITAANGNAPTHPASLGFISFKKSLEAESGGRIKVTVITDPVIGAEASATEQLRSGGFQVAEAVNGLLSSTYKKPIMTAWGLPFLYADSAAAYKAWDSPLATKSFATYEDLGIMCLARWDVGFRELSANKPVNTVADLKGLKIRTPTGQLYLDTWSALGAQPVGLAPAEVYTSLQTGVINATDYPLAAMISQKVYEVQKYEMLINYTNDPECLNISVAFYKSLPPDLQKAVRKAAADSSMAERAELKRQLDEALATLKAHGMTIVNPNLAPFREAVKTITDKYLASQGADGKSLLDGIQQAAK
jgi:tripartite ATP-independent transporter DctP family solute receptor